MQQTDSSVERRKGRSAKDISASKSVLITVENRLNSLSKHLSNSLEKRLEENPKPRIIQSMAKCLDLQDIIEKEEDIVVKGEREENLKIILNTAKYNDDHQAKILEQYEMFKLKVKDILEKGNENNEVLKRFEHLLFQTHACSTECDKKCPDKGKIVEPRVLIPMKLLHLFLKEPALYQGLKEFLHLYLCCLVKTHAEGVAESMGNVIEIHGDKRRERMHIEDLGREAFIHWNGPPVHKADRLGKKALDRHFKNGRWNFITQFYRTESLVIQRKKREESQVPFSLAGKYLRCARAQSLLRVRLYMFMSVNSSFICVFTSV